MIGPVFNRPALETASLEVVVDKLSAHPSVILSSRLCKKGWIAKPEDFHALAVCGLDEEEWKVHQRKALKCVLFFNLLFDS